MRWRGWPRLNTSVRRPTESSPPTVRGCSDKNARTRRGKSAPAASPEGQERMHPNDAFAFLRSREASPKGRAPSASEGSPLTPITLAGRITPCARPSMRRCGRAFARFRMADPRPTTEYPVPGKHATTGACQGRKHAVYVAAGGSAGTGTGDVAGSIQKQCGRRALEGGRSLEQGAGGSHLARPDITLP